MGSDEKVKDQATNARHPSHAIAAGMLIASGMCLGIAGLVCESGSSDNLGNYNVTSRTDEKPCYVKLERKPKTDGAFLIAVGLDPDCDENMDRMRLQGNNDVTQRTFVLRSVGTGAYQWQEYNSLEWDRETAVQRKARELIERVQGK